MSEENKMRAAVLTGPKELRVEVLDIPPTDDDSILLKVHRASICNATDYHVFDNTYLEMTKELSLPLVLGHECSGEVVEAGKNMKERFRIGERLGFGCKMGGMDGGAFAEYNRIYPDRLFSITRLDERLDYEEGSLLETLYGCLGGAHSAAVKPGDKVLVIGVGPVGLLHLQICRSAMALVLIAADMVDYRLRKAKEFGADTVINPEREDLAESIRGFCGGVDVIIDCTGENSPSLLDTGMGVLRPGGRYVVYSHAMGSTRMTPMTLATSGVRIVGIEPAHYGRMMPLANKLVSQGHIQLKSLVTHRIGLEQCEDALMMCHEKRDGVLKVIVEP